MAGLEVCTVEERQFYYSILMHCIKPTFIFPKYALPNLSKVKTDFAVISPSTKLSIILDSYSKNHSDETFEKDYIQNEFQFAGFSTLRFSLRHVFESPQYCIDTINRTIALDNFIRVPNFYPSEEKIYLLLKQHVRSENIYPKYNFKTVHRELSIYGFAIIADNVKPLAIVDPYFQIPPNIRNKEDFINSIHSYFCNCGWLAHMSTLDGIVNNATNSKMFVSWLYSCLEKSSCLLIPQQKN